MRSSPLLCLRFSWFSILADRSQSRLPTRPFKLVNISILSDIDWEHSKSREGGFQMVFHEYSQIKYRRWLVRRVLYGNKLIMQLDQLKSLHTQRQEAP